MNPEKFFVFSEENLKNIKGQLLNLKANTLVISGNSKHFIFDLFASIIIEALQFSKIIPFTQETQVAGIKKELDSCSIVKEKLKKFLTLTNKK